MSEENHSSLLCAHCSLLLCSPPRRSSHESPEDRVGSERSSRFIDGGVELFRREFRHSATSRARTLRSSIDPRTNKLDRLPALAAELVRLKVDVLFTPADDEA